jgi:hypothetical protein
LLPAHITVHRFFLRRLPITQERVATAAFVFMLYNFLDRNRLLVLRWDQSRYNFCWLRLALTRSQAVVEIVKEQDHVRFVLPAQRVFHFVLSNLNLNLRVLFRQVTLLLEFTDLASACVFLFRAAGCSYALFNTIFILLLNNAY